MESQHLSRWSTPYRATLAIQLGVAMILFGMRLPTGHLMPGAPQPYLQLSLSRIKNSSVEKSAKKQLKIRNPIKVQRPRESGQLHRRVILSPTERIEANPFPETSRVAPHASALAEEIVEYSSGECKGYSSSNPSDQD